MLSPILCTSKILYVGLAYFSWGLKSNSRASSCEWYKSLIKLVCFFCIRSMSLVCMHQNSPQSLFQWNLKHKASLLCSQALNMDTWTMSDCFHKGRQVRSPFLLEITPKFIEQELQSACGTCFFSTASTFQAVYSLFSIC